MNANPPQRDGVDRGASAWIVSIRGVVTWSATSDPSGRAICSNADSSAECDVDCDVPGGSHDHDELLGECAVDSGDSPVGGNGVFIRNLPVNHCSAARFRSVVIPAEFTPCAILRVCGMAATLLTISTANVCSQHVYQARAISSTSDKAHR